MKNSMHIFNAFVCCNTVKFCGTTNVRTFCEKVDFCFAFRARPVVKLHAKNSVEPEKIYLDQLSCTVPATNLKTSCFQIQSCFSYEGKSLPASIRKPFHFFLLQ